MSALISPEEENRAQAKFTAQLKSFARKYRCHVLMVSKIARPCSNVWNKYGEPRNLGCPEMG